MPLNRTDLYKTGNMSLLSTNEYIQNMIEDYKPSKEPPSPPNFHQTIITFLDGKKQNLWPKSQD